VTTSRSPARRCIAAAATVVCLVLAAVWLVVTPDEANGADGVRQALLLYGHTVVWLLLGLAAALYAIGAAGRAVESTAMLALGFYVAFVTALIL